MSNPNLANFTISSVSYGSSYFPINPPSSDSSGAFTYSSSNTSIADISGNYLIPGNAGSVTIIAYQAANGIYTDASINTTFTVNPIAPTISGFSFNPELWTSPPFQINTPSSNSAGDFTYSSSNTSIADISVNYLIPFTPGIVTITATQAANGNYIQGTSQAQLILQTPPIIGNFTISSVAYGSSSFPITDPSSNSSGAFTYSSSNTSVADISGNYLIPGNAGVAIITATQAANGIYTQGAVTTSFEVTVIAPTLGSLSIPSQPITTHL